ncbi:hypothetical protein WJX77_000498 [Trebouxia sp. C0004]
MTDAGMRIADANAILAELEPVQGSLLEDDRLNRVLANTDKMVAALPALMWGDCVLGIDNVWDERNGLLWAEPFEKAYHAHEIAVMYQSSSATFKFRVLTDKLMSKRLSDYGTSQDAKNNGGGTNFLNLAFRDKATSLYGASGVQTNHGSLTVYTLLSPLNSATYQDSCQGFCCGAVRLCTAAMSMRKEEALYKTRLAMTSAKYGAKFPALGIRDKVTVTPTRDGSRRRPRLRLVTGAASKHGLVGS